MDMIYFVTLFQNTSTLVQFEFICWVWCGFW